MKPSAAEEIIKITSDYYYNQLMVKLIYRLQRKSKGIRLNPDSDLKNIWEEICVQRQTDNWDGWAFVEHYIEGECALLIEYVPDEIKYVLSFDIVSNTEPVIYEKGIVDELVQKLYASATNFSNKRINKFIYGDY